MNLQDIEHKLTEIKPDLKKRFHVKRIGLFGSYVKGLAHEESDIDILVEFERPIGLIKFMSMQYYLSDKLRTPVDLLTFDSIKPYMKDAILKDVIYV